MSAVQVSTRPSKKVDQTGIMQGEQGRRRTETGQGKREHRPRINRTRRDVGWTVQGQDKASKSTDRRSQPAGKHHAKQDRGRHRDKARPSKMADQTGSTASKRADGTATGTGKQVHGPCRDRTR